MKNIPTVSTALLALLGIIGTPLFSQEQPNESATRAKTHRDLLVRYDQNKNGKLDAEEIEEIGRERFLKWDADGSGTVDQAELKTVREKTSKGPKQDKATRAAALARALTAAREQEEKDKRKRTAGGNPK